MNFDTDSRSMGKFVIAALMLFVQFCPRASDDVPVLKDMPCEVCQVLCVVLQESVEMTNPKTKLDTAAAASKVIAAAPQRGGPCKKENIWEPTLSKVSENFGKISLQCRKILEENEEALEEALQDPSVRDQAFRERICASGAKPYCKALWDESEVPMSKQKAAQHRAKADKEKEEARLKLEKEGKENDKKAKAFFKANRARTGVESLKSGLQIKVLQSGEGLGPPEPDQKVTVHYRGVNIDCVPQDGPVPCSGGTEFDSTYSCKEGTPSAEREACEKNKPISFTATQAGSFWPEILARMREGDQVEVYVPYKLAYGSTDDPNKRPDKVGPRAALIFQVDLLKVLPMDKKEEEKWHTVEGAETTYKIITSGEENGKSVKAGDTVTVHATGTVGATGKQFWSTKDPGQQPFTYVAGGGVIVGWDMGARGMRKGEVRQLRIPANEGYGANGFPSWGIPPNGDLIFELEVLNIKKNSEEL